MRRASLEDTYLALVHEEETGIRTGRTERVWQQEADR